MPAWRCLEKSSSGGPSSTAVSEGLPGPEAVGALVVVVVVVGVGLVWGVGLGWNSSRTSEGQWLSATLVRK